MRKHRGRGDGGGGDERSKVADLFGLHPYLRVQATWHNGVYEENDLAYFLALLKVHGSLLLDCDAKERYYAR